MARWLNNKDRSKQLKIHHYTYDSSKRPIEVLRVLLLRKRLIAVVLFQNVKGLGTTGFIKQRWKFADLWSLSKKLLLLQALSLLLDLLQPQLVVPSHDSAVDAGRHLSPLFHWSALGDPLLV